MRAIAPERAVAQMGRLRFPAQLQHLHQSRTTLFSTIFGELEEQDTPGLAVKLSIYEVCAAVAVPGVV